MCATGRRMPSGSPRTYSEVRTPYWPVPTPSNGLSAAIRTAPAHRALREATFLWPITPFSVSRSEISGPQKSTASATMPSTTSARGDQPAGPARVGSPPPTAPARAARPVLRGTVWPGPLPPARARIPTTSLEPTTRLVARRRSGRGTPRAGSPSPAGTRSRSPRRSGRSAGDRSGQEAGQADRCRGARRHRRTRITRSTRHACGRAARTRSRRRRRAGSAVPSNALRDVFGDHEREQHHDREDHQRQSVGGTEDGSGRASARSR